MRCSGIAPARVLASATSSTQFQRNSTPTLRPRSTSATATPSRYSVTVPQHVVEPAFFAPLADLRLPEATEIYFALVPYHPEQQAPGTTEQQVPLIDQHVGSREWGICTECGMGRVEREDVPAMLDAHREILARFVHV